MLLFAVTMTVKTVLWNSSTIRSTVDLDEEVQFEFPCSAWSDDSTPEVSVRWYRVDEETDEEIEVRVIPDKLTVNGNGSLVIQLAKNDAEGWDAFLKHFRGQDHVVYKCHASNAYSEAVRVASIHINNYVAPSQYLHLLYVILYLQCITALANRSRNFYARFGSRFLRVEIKE